MIRLRRFASIIAALALVSGCGTSGDDTPTSGVDLTELVGVLPTPAGLDQSSDVRRAQAADVQAALAGVARAESAEAFESRGFAEGAIRRWAGPAGATFTVVTSRWPDHVTASAVGGGAVNLPLDRDIPGATPWNPSEVRGARGARIGPPSAPARLLAVAVGDVSLFARADGPVDDAAVVRTMDLLRRRLEAPQA